MVTTAKVRTSKVFAATTAALATAALLLVSPATALAADGEAPAQAPAPEKEKEKEKETATPTIHHAPRVSARIGQDIRIGAAIDRIDKVKRALLLYKGTGFEGAVEFARSSDETEPYVAVIPGGAVRGAMLAYAIEIETTEGETVPVFASRARPHPVTVLDSAEDAREGALLTRLGGRRSVVQTSGEYVSFGTTDADVAIRGAAGAPSRVEHRSVKDQYYRVEGSYTYRLLGVVSEFGMRAGAVRGRSLVPGESDPSKYDVGLNYGAPRVRLRATDWLHFEGELLISVTEVGFSTGGGGAVLLGDAYGSKMTLGFEAVQVFGVRGYTRLDIVANHRLSLSPIVEVSNMPHADTAGVRLLGEAGMNLGGGFHASLRGGYQARSFDQGGPTLGGGLSYAF
jgi:hypothetical protein